MNKKLKKLLCGVISAAMVSASVVIPTTAGAEEFTPIFTGDTVLKEWKFDFGAADSTPEDGYTLISPDMNFVANAGGKEQYGFLGTAEEDYNLTDRYDGWRTQKGQNIELAAGGGTGLNDAVGVVGAGGKDENAGKDIFGNQADIYYPTRFALKVEDDTYYRIRATVTTLDPTKDATVSLYTERKHPIYTQKTISAGTTDTIDFSVRVTPIYYEKSNPTGAIKDEMVTVGVLGENSALASVQIQQVETIPTVWVLGDSTVTDGNTTLPFFPLQNYTGVGTGLTKYLSRDVAMVNEGEGGLNAADNYHFNMVKDRIKAGDYMYVEYGHNHKNDGPSGYKACLDKYYNACHAVGAKLLIVSPVQSISGWNDTTKKWNDRFGGDDNFEGAGKSYVEEKVAAGATDIAFANLTKTSVEFVDKVTEDGGNVADAAKFYYQTGKGGGTDASHPNDAGAENFAYCFFTAMKEITDETQKAVVQPLIDGMTAELPNLVSPEVVAGGIGGSAWPTYIVPSPEKYPVVIKDVAFNEDGTVKQVDVITRAAETTLSTYGVIIITIYNADGTEKGKIYAVDQVDNSVGYGPQTITKFRGDVTLAEGETYTAVVVEADADVQPVDDGQTYSAVYKPTDISEFILTNVNKDGGENFDYYGAVYEGDSPSSLTDFNSWKGDGSAGKTLTLGVSGETKYANIITDGIKNGNANQGSFYVSKNFESPMWAYGRYMLSADIKYLQGSGLNFTFVTGNTTSAPWGTESITAFTVNSEGKITMSGKEVGQISATEFTNVKYILDVDLGTASISINGSDEITVDMPNYNTTSLNIAPTKLTGFMFDANKTAVGIQVSDLTVAKLKDKTLPEYTAEVKASDDSMGNISIKEGIVPAPLAASLDYDGTNATITATNALETTLIEVKDGKINSQKISFTEAGTKTASVTEGSILYLWDSLSSLKPHANSITATYFKSLKLPINTVVTARAAAKEGYVFMGWNDAEGNFISSDLNYSFRLRDNITLTAQFAKEPGVEDITDFSLDAESKFIKAVSGKATTMKIVNPIDKDGTPMNKVTNADIAWSTSDENITVDSDGVVSIGDAFTMGDALTKTVVVTGTLNGIAKTCEIVFHSYNYYEDFSAVNDSWGFTTEGGAEISDGCLKLLTKSSANKSSEMVKTLGTDVSGAKKVSVKFDWKSLVESNKGRHSNFVLRDSDNKVIFLIRGVGNAGLFCSTTADEAGYEKISNFNQNWVTVDLIIDFEAKTINGAISDSDGNNLKTFTDVAMTDGAANLANMFATNTYSAAPMAIDNVCIKIY